MQKPEFCASVSILEQGRAVTTDGIEGLMELCREAVRLHGSDWARVKSHVDARLGSLAAAERTALDREVALVNLAVTAQPEDAGPDRH